MVTISEFSLLCRALKDENNGISLVEILNTFAMYDIFLFFETLQSYRVQLNLKVFVIFSCITHQLVLIFWNLLRREKSLSSSFIPLLVDGAG